MSTTFHLRDQLSAYLDGALAPAERAAVEMHLGSCAECRSHLAELRGVASLIAALPDVAPSRRLVPRLATAPAWVAPLRTLATLASGVSVFLFMATAILANVGWLAQTSSPAAGRAAAPAAAPAASAALRDAASPPPANSDAKLQASAAPTNASAFAAQSASERGAASGGFLVGPAPWVWLVLAVVTGAIALALQRRLRSA